MRAAQSQRAWFLRSLLRQVFVLDRHGAGRIRYRDEQVGSGLHAGKALKQSRLLGGNRQRCHRLRQVFQFRFRR
jgi:hypothetical protein